LKVCLHSFIRAEALFSNFDALILAIQCDIERSLEELREAEGAKELNPEA